MSNTKNYQQETGLLPAASLASRTASQEKGERTKTSAIYGLNAGECCASYDQTRHCLKTCQDYLFQMKGGFSTEYYLTFTNAGMMRSGKLYPLHKSAHHICVKESGSFAIRNIDKHKNYWRTPDANMNRGKRSFENMKMRLEKKKPLNLNDQINAINKGLLTAPCAKKENSGLAFKTQETQELNPDWVEALMGYPQFWTDITKDTIIEVDYFKSWKDNSWESDLPRETVITKNRIKRLKCLGNSVVPEITTLIFKMIMKTIYK